MKSNKSSLKLKIKNTFNEYVINLNKACNNKKKVFKTLFVINSGILGTFDYLKFWRVNLVGNLT